MSADFARKVTAIIETKTRSRAASVEFELAYQARAAADRIRFAIGQIEESAQHSDQIRNASLELLDALDRIESADRHFQELRHQGITANEGMNNVQGAPK